MQNMCLIRRAVAQSTTTGVVCHVNVAHTEHAPLGPVQCTTEQCDCNDEDLTANQTDYVYHTASVQVCYECTYRY